MLHHRGNGGQPADEEWHAFREQARKTAFSKEEFSDIDQTRFDLDTAGITGEDNPDSYDGEDVTPDVQGTPESGDGAGDRPWE